MVSSTGRQRINARVRVECVGRAGKLRPAKTTRSVEEPIVMIANDRKGGCPRGGYVDWKGS